MLRRQRAAVLERDAKLAAYVTDRLAEGWTPEQIAGRLRLGIETGLRAVCPETLYGGGRCLKSACGYDGVQKGNPQGPECSQDNFLGLSRPLTCRPSRTGAAED